MRNSSFALATLRPDGFVGVALQGDVLTTVPVLCTGAVLVVTVDVAAPHGSVQVGALGADPGLSYRMATRIVANSTDLPVTFHAGANFGSLVGRNVTLQFAGTAAFVYTFGFQ